MNAYTQVLEFFMENGIQLNKEQLEALQEEFSDEQLQVFKDLWKEKKEKQGNKNRLSDEQVEAFKDLWKERHSNNK